MVNTFLYLMTIFTDFSYPLNMLNLNLFIVRFGVDSLVSV